MSRSYPVVPTPMAMFDLLTGTFDPVAGSPALINGAGADYRRYIVTQPGSYNFATATPGSGTSLLAGDEVIYIAGTWRVIQRGATGDFLPRDGTVAMAGPIDTAAHGILLRDGVAEGTSDAERATIRYVQIAAGDWAARTALLQVRARGSGNPSSVALLTGELASDVTLAKPTLLIGINGSGDTALLVGPARQVELTGDQTAAGHKTFRQISFGASGQEMHLPTVRGTAGQALILQANGNAVWGSVQLSANVSAIALTGGASVVAAFNAAGPFVIGQSDLTFITWQSALYVWSGGPGTFGSGATQATSPDIVGPILSFAGVAFATVGEVQAGVVTGKAIDPAVAAASLLVKDGAGQTIVSALAFSGDGLIQSAWRMSTGATFDVEAGATLTVQDAPRGGSPGAKDAVNRTALDARFQAASSATGGGNASKGVILDGAGKVDRAVLPMTTPVDWQGFWSPGAPGAKLLRNAAGGGCTPALSPGALLYATADGRWNFTTGASDPSGFQVLAGMLLLLDGANIWQPISAPGSGGGGSTAALLRDGSLPMSGDLSFGASLRLTGNGPNAPVTIENAIIDGGTL